MNKRNASLLGTIVSGLLLQSTLAGAATTARYIWSSSKGLQKAGNCVVNSQDQIPLYLVEKNGKLQDGVVSTANLEGAKRSSLKELSESILDLKSSGAKGKIEGHELQDTLLQAAFDDSGSDYATLLCTTSAGRNGYALFNVFAPGKEDPIAQLAVSKGDAAFLRNAKVHNVEEAMQIVQSRMQQQSLVPSACNTCAVPSTTAAQTPAAKSSTSSTTAVPKIIDETDARVAAVNTSIVQQAQASIAAAQATSTKTEQSAEVSMADATEEGQGGEEDSHESSDSKNYVICSPSDEIRVRDASLKTVLFNAKRSEKITLMQKLGTGKALKVDGKQYSFIQVQFSGRKVKQSGFVAEQMVKTAEQCAGGSVAQTPNVSKPITPTPSVTTPTTNTSNLNAPTCASRKVLASAKVNVAKRWRNNSRGTGACALGVRQSLQMSGVGGISGGLGNAIDMVGPLKARGFVEISERNAKQIPAGAIMIFSGPLSSQYLRNGKMRRPYGNYVGHITIKGDDGFYYTDGRTPEPAIGWSGDVNVAGRRNLYSVLVPGQSLVQQYADSCK